MPRIQVISKMIASAIACLHANSIVHGDIKGDTSLAEPARDGASTVSPLHARLRHCLLQDSWLEIEAVERHADVLGAEMWDASYSVAEDILAMGIVAAGMVDRRFPLGTETDVKTKPFKLPSWLPKEGDSWVQGLLVKRDTGRLTTDQVLQHPFIDSIRLPDEELPQADSRSSPRNSKEEAVVAKSEVAVEDMDVMVEETLVALVDYVWLRITHGSGEDKKCLVRKMDATSCASDRPDSISLSASSALPRRPGGRRRSGYCGSCRSRTAASSSADWRRPTSRRAECQHDLQLAYPEKKWDVADTGRRGPWPAEAPADSLHGKILASKEWPSAWWGSGCLSRLW